MDIRNLCLYFFINCAVFGQVLYAKTFSINEALAAEAKYKKRDTATNISKESSPQRLSLITAEESQLLSKIKDRHPQKANSLTRYKKPYFLESILKPTTLSELLAPLRLHQRSSRKREINNGTKRYPLLKNLGHLLDNLFNTVPGDSNEIKPKRSARKRGILCKCAYQPELGTKESHQTTTFITKIAPFTAASVETATADSPVTNIISQEQVNDISVLFPRDSPSDRGNSSGHGERSSSAFYRDIQRNISRNIRDREHFPRNSSESSAKGYERVTHSSPRDSSSSSEGNRKSGRKQNSFKSILPEMGGNYKEYKKSDTIFGRESTQSIPRKTKHKIGEIETESQTYLPQLTRRLRRPLPKHQEGNITEPIQSNKPGKESVKDVAFDNTSDKQIIDRSSATTTNAKRASSEEELISIEDLSNLKLALRKTSHKKAPAVTIIDGYSIARDKNNIKDLCASEESSQ